MRIVRMGYVLMLTCLDPAYPWQGYAKDGELVYEDRALAEQGKRAIETIHRNHVIADVEEIELPEVEYADD